MTNDNQQNTQNDEIFVFNFLKKYSCLIDKCPNDCCSNWTVDVEKNTLKKWAVKHPELIDLTETNPHRPNDIRMKSEYKYSEGSSSCVCFDKNKGCLMHAKHGESILPNVCKSYPQVYKRFGNKIISGATVSCASICYIISDENEDNNFKISQEQYNIKKDPSTIYDIFELQNAPQHKVDEYSKISVFNFYNYLIEKTNQFSNTKQLFAAFTTLCVSLDNFGNFKIANDYKQILDAYFYKLSTRELIDRANLKFTTFYKNLIIDIGLKLLTKEVDFILKIKSLMDEFVQNQAIIEVAYLSFTSNQDIYNHYYKYIRRFFKVKMAECVFPFAVHYNKFKDFALSLCVQTMFVELVFASFYHKSQLNDLVAQDIIHFVERDFYGKKNQRILDEISSTNLDNPENLFGCFV